MPTCELCDLQQRLPETLKILGTTDWTVFIHPDQTAPTCVWVTARSHCEGLWALSDVQAASLGPVLRDASRALRAATQAARIYVVSFGENHKHFHAVLVTRPDSMAATRGVARMSEQLSCTDGSSAERAEIAAEIRRTIETR